MKTATQEAIQCVCFGVKQVESPLTHSLFFPASAPHAM
jgi:hypothetical protein